VLFFTSQVNIFSLFQDISYIYVGGIDVVMFTVHTIRNGLQNNTMIIICPKIELQAEFCELMRYKV